MRADHKLAIEQSHNFLLTQVDPGPRGFVAETYILHAQNQARYFCKVVNKPVFIAQLKRSLPILDAIHSVGFDQIPHPIKTKDGGLYIERAGTLIVLFNYIDAPQSYEYDLFAFGVLTARAHQLLAALDASVLPAEDFIYEHQSEFEELFLSEKYALSSEPVALEFQQLVRQHRATLLRYYQRFGEAAAVCRENPPAFVITHGDAPGNTLVKTPTDLYIIDWDDLKSAPPERDTWFLADKPAFLQGYRSVIPTYHLNAWAQHFSTLSYHFNSIVHYCNEIFSDNDTSYRRSNLEKLSEYLSEKSWISPYLRVIDQTE